MRAGQQTISQVRFFQLKAAIIDPATFFFNADFLYLLKKKILIIGVNS
jgi:hypothetical protein